MKNYKYSFLAIALIMSTASYSAYEFDPSPEKVKEYSSHEGSTKARPKKSEQLDVEVPECPFTLSALAKATTFCVGYYYYLEYVQQRVKDDYGTSAGEITKILPGAIFAEQIKDFAKSCSIWSGYQINRGWRSVNPCC